MIKKILPWILGAALLVSMAAGLLFNHRLVKADLTNVVLAEKLRISKTETAYIHVKYKLLGDASTIKVMEWQGRTEKAEANEKLIQTKSANEIKAIRNQKGELQSKYDTLEFEALKLSDKMSAQNSLVLALKGEIAELHVRDNVRLEYIGELEGKLGECQRLLDISIANTASILKKSWILKLFGNIKIGPGIMMGIDGKPHFGIGAIWAIN